MALRWMPLTEVSPRWWLVNIGSGNGLTFSTNKPLPKPMLTKFYDAITGINPEAI